MSIIRCRLRDPLSLLYPQQDYTVIGWCKDTTLYGENGVYAKMHYAHDILSYPFNPLFVLDFSTRLDIEWYETSLINVEGVSFTLAADDEAPLTGLTKVNLHLRKWGINGVESLSNWKRKINPYPYDSRMDVSFLSSPSYRNAYLTRAQESNLFYLVNNALQALHRGAQRIYFEDLYHWYQEQAQLRGIEPVERENIVTAGLLSIKPQPFYSSFTSEQLRQELLRLNQEEKTPDTANLQGYLIQLLLNFQ